MYFFEVEATIGFKKAIVNKPIKKEKVAGVITIDIDDLPAALKTVSSEFRVNDRKVHAELKIIIKGKT
jgi:hypothetical protein